MGHAAEDEGMGGIGNNIVCDVVCTNIAYFQMSNFLWNLSSPNSQ